MNCPECRKHLYPYLDDELEVTQNLAILEHLNCCGACRDLFAAEEISWRLVRRKLESESLPEDLAGRIESSIVASDRRQTRRRAFVFLGGAAAVVLAVLALDHAGAFRVAGDVPPPDGQGPTVTNASHDHGPGIKACMEAFGALIRKARSQSVDVLNREFLEQQNYRIAADEQRSCLLTLLCSRKDGIPSTCCQTTTRVAYRKIDLAGIPDVLHGVFDYCGEEIAIYKLTRAQARLAGMHDLPAGRNADIHLSRCRKCRVVAVSEGDAVWILVARPGADTAVAFAEQVF